MSGAYALRPSAAAGACLNGRGGLTAPVKLALCLIPDWIRILQCGRRLRDERARLHVVNIGKYGAGAAALIIRYLRDARPPNAGWTAAAALTCLASSAYSYAWCAESGCVRCVGEYDADPRPFVHTGICTWTGGCCARPTRTAACATC